MKMTRNVSYGRASAPMNDRIKCRSPDYFGRIGTLNQKPHRKRNKSGKK
ncbi:MAG: hypothetical protein K6A68_09730 [Clostridiales bacterium]|nr:hypothetical protein [Clostridiales bacterium]